DIDHGHDYARGGPTAVENLEALCPAHHQMKHQAGWKVRQVAGGVIEFTTPAGHTVTDGPISRVFFQESPAAAQCERDEIAREHAVADNARRAQDRADARRSARPPRARWPHRSNESPNGARAAFDEPEVRVILGPDGDLVETCDAWLDQDAFLDMLRSGRIRDPHPEPR
ncbi:MAG TPA: HNH endonuclease, partial [Candidatus Microbacterium stercoravium]|nr:HNH endonuclease [Candidatus Microbacterium stercoravium]